MNRVNHLVLFFEECGFDIDIIGLQRIVSSGNRWRTSYKQNGVWGLRDTRKGKLRKKVRKRTYIRGEICTFGSGTKLIKS